jgi:hypothetical protein
MEIFCPICNDIANPFEDWVSYARHIIQKHPKDKERVQWAKDSLSDKGLPFKEDTVEEIKEVEEA